jgi:hypothetical protein
MKKGQGMKVDEGRSRTDIKEGRKEGRNDIKEEKKEGGKKG